MFIDPSAHVHIAITEGLSAESCVHPLASAGQSLLLVDNMDNSVGQHRNI